MIILHTVYNVKCNQCGKLYAMTSDSISRIQSDVVELGGWLALGDRHYCKDCRLTVTT